MAYAGFQLALIWCHHGPYLWTIHIYFTFFLRCNTSLKFPRKFPMSFWFLVSCTIISFQIVIVDTFFALLSHVLLSMFCVCCFVLSKHYLHWSKSIHWSNCNCCYCCCCCHIQWLAMQISPFSNVYNQSNDAFQIHIENEQFWANFFKNHSTNQYDWYCFKLVWLFIDWNIFFSWFFFLSWLSVSILYDVCEKCFGKFLSLLYFNK